MMSPSVKEEQSTYNEANVIVIDYRDLIGNHRADDGNDTKDTNKALQQSLYAAFGAPDACGLIAIRNVPGFVSSKQALLPQGYDLAHLSPTQLQALEDPDTLYNAGWSFGKEKLGDVVDTAKASFYYHPLADVPGSDSDREKYPLSYPSNKWPPSDAILEFEVNAKRLGSILYQVTVQLSRQLDRSFDSDATDSCTTNITRVDDTVRLEEFKSSSSSISLYDLLKDTDKIKARLLYYYPTTNATSNTTSSSNDKFDSWIGWHNDSGFLTALAGDIYVDHATGQVFPEYAMEHPSAGLYVYNLQGQLQHVTIPSDCCAVQMGEAAQILLGGRVAATPHCVRPTDSVADSVARISLACFVDSRPDTPLRVPVGCTREQVLQASVCREGIPPLQERWIENGMPFGDFLTRTFTHFYQHNDCDLEEKEHDISV
jgi:isopenicillin N synthase-like dioxygenase